MKIQFPRIAQDMARYGKQITDPDKLKSGDLVFFFDTYEINRIITSVGIYIGNGEFIHSSTSDGVTLTLKITEADGTITEITIPIGTFTF